MIARTYSSEELAHEALMAQLGEERARSRIAAARQFDRLSLTVSGRGLLRRFFGPVKRVIHAWLDSKDHGEAIALYRPLREMLAEFDTEVVSLLAVQTVVDGIHRVRTLNRVANAIGHALEDEYRCRAFKAKNPGLWSDMAKRTKRSRPSSKRRRILCAGRYHDALPPAWPANERLRLGLLVLQAIVTGTRLVEVGVEWKQTPRFNKSFRVIIPTKETIEWLEQADDAWATMSPIYLPTLEEPIPWEGPEGGGYLTDLVLGRPVARFHDDAQRQALEEPGRVPPSASYHALNALQACAWKVSEDVRQCVEDIWMAGAGVGGLPPRDDVPIPDKPADIAENAESRRAYCRVASDAYRLNHELRSQRCGVAIHKIAAQRMAPFQRFYFPHRLDFRGRAYPTLAGLSPQGPDMCRAMLRFADEDELTDRRWLHITGANLFGVKGTLTEREEAGKLLVSNRAVRVYEDPLDARDLWLEASEPWQFLAWCLEVGDIHRKTTGLPCHVDASNNGLQILSILAGDRTLAKLTNVLPNERPSDIYQTVADRAEEAVNAEARGELRSALDRPLKKLSRDQRIACAKEWLAVLPGGKVARACAKRPVMTLPYGVTPWSAQRYVRDWSEEVKLTVSHFTDGKHKAFRYLANVIMEEVKGLCGSAIAVMKYLQTCSTLIVKSGNLPAWTAPSGWPVVQHYREQVAKTIKAPLAQSISTLHIRHGRGKPSVTDNRLGIAPNFVHSIDASVMAYTLDGWERSVAAIHDSFATTSPYVPDLLARAKRAFVQCIVDADPLGDFANHARSKFRVKIPDPPERAEPIRAEEVLASEYLFS